MSTQTVSVQQVTSEELVKISQSIHNLSLEEVEAALAMLHAAREESLNQPIDKKVRVEAEEVWNSFRQTLENRHQSKLKRDKASLEMRIAVEAIVTKYLDSDTAVKLVPVLNKCIREGDFKPAKNFYEGLEKGEYKDTIRMIVHSFKLKSWDNVGAGSTSGLATIERVVKEIANSPFATIGNLTQDLTDLGIISL
jgi:hypothetical protein